MEIHPIKLAVLKAPQDDLLQKILKSKLTLKEGDIVAVTSKVVSIHEGRCVKASTKGHHGKDVFSKKESEFYLERKYVPGRHAFHTITKGVLIRSAGIDESNGNGYYILWPKDPQASANVLLQWFKKEYKIKKLGLVITDSWSVPLRRGAIGFALAAAGFEPIFDYRGLPDIFGRKLKFSQANVADALAASAVLTMGEGKEQTPLAIIQNAPNVWANKRVHNKTYTSFQVPLKEDIFYPFFAKQPWKKGGR
jgi:F420-0:gamma-glutamyl ligase